jgi:hypothetical protein
VAKKGAFAPFNQGAIMSDDKTPTSDPKRPTLPPQNPKDLVEGSDAQTVYQLIDHMAHAKVAKAGVSEPINAWHHKP